MSTSEYRPLAQRQASLNAEVERARQDEHALDVELAKVRRQTQRLRSLASSSSAGPAIHQPRHIVNMRAALQYDLIPDPECSGGNLTLGGVVRADVATSAGTPLKKRGAAAGHQFVDDDDDDDDDGGGGGGGGGAAPVSAATGEQQQQQQHSPAQVSPTGLGPPVAGGQAATPSGELGAEVQGQLMKLLCESEDLTPAALNEALEPLPAEVMATPDDRGETPLHWLCEHRALTVELLAAGRERLPAEAMATPDKECGGFTPLHRLCLNSALKVEVLTAGRQGLAAEAMTTPTKIGVTPLHLLCSNNALTLKLLEAGRHGLKLQAMATPTKDGVTPLLYLCGNKALTLDLLRAGREGLPAEVMLTPDGDGDTLLDELCGNSAFTTHELAILWSANLDPLEASLNKNNAARARDLVNLLPKGLPPRTEDDTHGGSDDSAGPGGTQPHESAPPPITLAQVPGMVGKEGKEGNLQRMYSGGLGSVATALLREHGVVDAGYAPRDTFCRDCDRAELGPLGLAAASAGSEKLVPTFEDNADSTIAGIDWSQHLKVHQCASGNNKRINVKPVVLAVCDAARAADKGLLHVLARPGVPVSAFDTRIAKLLIAHKWQAFGNRMFLIEAAVFVLMLAAWQTLALLVAQHGDAAMAELTTGCAVAGALLGVAVPGLLAAARACLPLVPRTPKSGFRPWEQKWLLDNLNWYIRKGWYEDGADSKRRQWSPLGVFCHCLDDKLPGLVFFPLWYLVVFPSYHALTLATHLGPAYGAAVLLGATPSSVLGLRPTSLSALALTCLLATTTRNIVLELREANGSTRLTAKLKTLEAPYKREGARRVLCGVPNAVVLLAKGFRVAVVAIKSHLTAEIWNGLDLATLTFNILIAIRVLSQCDAVITCQLAVVNTTLLWLRLVQLLGGFDSTAVYVSMFTSVFSKMLSFLLMIGIFVVSNGFALNLLYPSHLHGSTAAEKAALAAWTTDTSSDTAAMDELSGTVWRAMFASFDMALGEFDRVLLDDAFSPVLAYFMFIEYILVVNIVMLNLLIALMGGAYERVAETARLVRQKQRAELILQYERLMSTADRSNLQWHPRYLHALVPADELEEEAGAEEAGVINGVKRLLLSNAHSGESLESKINTRMDQKLQGVQEHMDGRLGQFEREMNAKIDKMDEKMDKTIQKIQAHMDENVVQMNEKLDEVLALLMAGETC
eukprot:COSAG01_NODE_3395_length_6148_cov_1.985948_1_plen_1195_part_00